MALKIITTEDGSHSLYDDELNETYHSTKGALGESLHVFIREGLEFFLREKEVPQVSILEVGLGTGLNAFLTAKLAEDQKTNISFASLEPFPVSKEIYQALNYHQSPEEKELFQKIHESDWGEECAISSYFRLQKTTTKLEYFNTSKLYHLIYFDAFAPSKQSEVWSIENLRRCFELLAPSGILTSYCAQGQFKRNLSEVGFVVETLQGAMGKKEMVRAVKQ